MKRLSRRSVLLGLGGFGITLPFLEIMGGSDSARAQVSSSSRYIVCFAGVSTGTTQDFVAISCPTAKLHQPDHS